MAYNRCSINDRGYFIIVVCYYYYSLSKLSPSMYAQHAQGVILLELSPRSPKDFSVYL